MSLILVDVVLGAIALLCIGWTVVALWAARHSAGKAVGVYYAQSAAYAVVSAALVGLIYATNSGSRIFGDVMCGLIVVSLVFRRVNIRRLKLPASKLD